jgi:hypothetical protein
MTLTAMQPRTALPLLIALGMAACTASSRADDKQRKRIAMAPERLPREQVGTQAAVEVPSALR